MLLAAPSLWPPPTRHPQLRHCHLRRDHHLQKISVQRPPSSAPNAARTSGSPPQLLLIPGTSAGVALDISPKAAVPATRLAPRQKTDRALLDEVHVTLPRLPCTLQQQQPLTQPRREYLGGWRQPKLISTGIDPRRRATPYHPAIPPRQGRLLCRRNPHSITDPWVRTGSGCRNGANLLFCDRYACARCAHAASS